jgi:predicted DNA-binding antitoxin AbrB/MazE fold protein
MKTIHAVFEHGVFRPLDPVELPEASHVEFEPKVIAQRPSAPSLDDVYAVLGQSFDTGETDIAARHDEHQP